MTPFIEVVRRKTHNLCALRGNVILHQVCNFHYVVERLYDTAQFVLREGEPSTYDVLKIWGLFVQFCPHFPAELSALFCDDLKMT